MTAIDSEVVERALRVFVDLQLVPGTGTMFVETIHSLLEEKDLTGSEKDFLRSMLGGMRLLHLASHPGVTDHDVIESLESFDRKEFVGTLNLIKSNALPKEAITSEIVGTLVRWMNDPRTCQLALAHSAQRLTCESVQEHVARAIVEMYRREVAWFEDDVIHKASEIADEQVQVRVQLFEA